jgi:hypothetical protein
MSRLAEITRCTDTLALIQAAFRARSDDPMALLLGQLDWYEELHRLLYDVEADA